MKLPWPFSSGRQEIYHHMGMSPGVLADLMRRVEQVYYETGGKFSSEQDIVKGLSPFEAHKVMIALKIKATKEKIQKLEDAHTHKRGIRIEAKLSVEVHKMIELIKEDRKKMLEIHRKNAKHAKRVRKFPILKKHALSQEALEMQEADLELITRHIIELEELRRLKSRKRIANKKDYNELHAGYSIPGTSSTQSAEDPDMTRVRQLMIQEKELHPELTAHLPELDISWSLQKVREADKQLDIELDTFNQRLKHLHQQSLAIGTELDEQSLLIDDINKKSEKRKEQIALLNKRLDRCINHVDHSQRLCCITCLLCCILAFAVAGLVIVANGEKWGINIPTV